MTDTVPAINRRKLLLILVGLGISANAPASHLFHDGGTGYCINKSLFASININFTNLEQYVELYLAAKPTAINQEMVEHDIFDQNASWKNTEAMIAFLQTKIADDFVSQQTISIDGWVLSKTEVQMWYVYYLLKKHTVI